jgi:hypothetical protein
VGWHGSVFDVFRMSSTQPTEVLIQRATLCPFLTLDRSLDENSATAVRKAVNDRTRFKGAVFLALHPALY